MWHATNHFLEPSTEDVRKKLNNLNIYLNVNPGNGKLTCQKQRLRSGRMVSWYWSWMSHRTSPDMNVWVEYLCGWTWQTGSMLLEYRNWARRGCCAQETGNRKKNRPASLEAIRNWHFLAPWVGSHELAYITPICALNNNGVQIHTDYSRW